MQTTTSTAVPYAKRWAALFLLCTAQFMVIMDTSIIGVALPAIQRSLGYSASSLQWIFNAYVVVFGGLLLVGGKLSDLFGPRRVFLYGFGILTASSLLAGFAWSDSVLNIARGLQGLGSALIAPSALTLVMTMFTDQRELGKALGFWGAAAAAGGSAGVFLGEVLTEWLSWPWVFFINVPLGLIVMGVGPSLLLKGERQKGRIDIAGALLATTSLVTMVYAIVTGEHNGWLSARSLTLFAVAIVLFIIFLRSQKNKASALLPLSIFKAPNLAAGNLVMALMAGAWIPLWFYLNLYLQQSLGLSAFYSGLALLPMTLVIMVLMVGLMGKLIPKFGPKNNLVAGLIALTAALVWFATIRETGSFMGDVLWPSLLAALGMSLAYIPGTILSMSGAKPEETGLASGIVNTSYQIGSAIGLAIVVAIATAITGSTAQEGVTELTSMTTGFRAAFITAAIISGLSALIALFRIRMPKS